MKKHLISSTIYEYSEDELSSIDRQLIDAARQATERSYAP